MRVEVERHYLKDGGWIVGGDWRHERDDVSSDSDGMYCEDREKRGTRGYGDSDAEDLDREVDPDEYDSEGWRYEIEWRRGRKLWSDDEGSVGGIYGDDDGSEDEDAEGEDDEDDGEEDLVVLNPQSGRKRRPVEIDGDEVEDRRKVNPRFEP